MEEYFHIYIATDGSRKICLQVVGLNMKRVFWSGHKLSENETYIICVHICHKDISGTSSMKQKPKD